MGFWSGAGRCCRCKVTVSGRALILFAFLLLTVDARWVTGAVAAAAVHELGHLAALWVFDVRVLGIRIDVPGAVIRTEPMEPSQELLCALSGPAFGLLLCLFRLWVPRTAVLALGQSLYNLIPVWPMDGGRGLLALRNICCKEREKGVQ